MAIVTIFIVFVVTYLVSKHFFRNENLPPGPKFSLPIIGNILNVTWGCFVGKLQQHELMYKWAGRYGKVFSYRLGTQLIVVLNDATLTRDIFSTDDIANRPASPLLEEINCGIGVVFSSGQVWREQRKFALGVFRSLGIGKSSFETTIIGEAKHLTSEIKKQSAFDPQVTISKASSNIISSVVLGQRFSYADENFNNVMKRLRRNFQLGGFGGVLLFFPSLKFVPGMSKIFDEFKSNMTKNFQFVLGIYKMHKETFDRDNPRDLIDSGLIEVERRANKGSHSSALEESNFVATISNLFAAGTDTTSSTLSWFILYVATHPDIQQRIHEEIDSIVGRDRLPNMADKSKLPFTEAAILEVMRLQPVAPLVPHCASRDTSIEGYHIPKDTIVVGNIWHMLHDQAVWENPFEFKPERFLTDDGTLNTKSNIMVPFSVGRRVCLGEQLAKMELFIFATHLMHQFRFDMPEDCPQISFEGISGITYAPKPYEVVATCRV